MPNAARWFGLPFALFLSIAGAASAQEKLPASGHALPSQAPAVSLIDPQAWQFDLQISGLFGFTGPGSIVRVREFETEGTGLHFSSMDLNTEQMPTFDLRFWLDDLDALHLRFRYFNMGGTRFSSTPIRFNGATIPGGRTNTFDPSKWFSFFLYYERRLMPWYQSYEAGWPSWLQRWDLRARLGIEYTYLDFSINGGKTPTTTTTPIATPTTTTTPATGEETKEDFYHQSMPLPTIGVEAYRELSDNFLFQAELEGNWINRWNSTRNEGGTVWASQNGIELHLRLYYFDPSWLGPVQPMVGFFLYTYSQLEDSHEDGNFIRWSSYGPEIGISSSL